MFSFFSFVIGSISLFGAIGWDMAEVLLVDEDIGYYINLSPPIHFPDEQFT